MGIRWFIVGGVVAFIIATLGSDVFVQVTIGSKPFIAAIIEHLHWVIVEFVGTATLLVPFIILAVIGWWVEDRTSTRNGLLVFGIFALYLIYDYFEGYRSALIASMDRRWTAAALSIGFLPFGAIPVLLIAWLVGFLLVLKNRAK